MAEADVNVLDNDTSDNEVKSDSAQDIESQIQLAMRSRVSHFKEQADSLTFEGVRRLMEKDLGLETYALDVHKRFIKTCLSECLDNADKDDGPKSAVETVEINMATTEEKVADLPNKQLIKKEVKHANSDDEDKMEDSPVMGLLTGDEKTKTKDSGKSCNKGIPSEKMIEVAIKKRAAYFRANSDDITMGGVRKLLEEDLELEKNSLLPFKKFIAEKIDHVLSASAAAASKVKPKIKTEDKISNKKELKNVSREEPSDYSDGEIEKNKKPVQRNIKKTVESKKRKRGSKEIEAPSEKKKEAHSSEGNSGKSNDGSASEDSDSASPAAKPTKMKKETEAPAYGKHVENLKSIIKSCGMSVPPVVYKRVKQIPENKREAALIKEFKDILSKEGLSSNPSEKEIKDVRKKKERLKELEGIDMSNIVSSTRRRSSTSFPPPPPKPKLPVESDSDEGEEDEDSENDDEDSENDDEDVEGEGDLENDNDVDNDVDNDEASDEEEEDDGSD